jgi:hypothetical protein
MSEKSKLTIDELVKYYGDVECPHCKGKFYLDRPDEVALKAILYDQHIELQKTRNHYIQACVQRDNIKKQLTGEIEALKTEIKANIEQEPPDGYWLISFGKLKNEHDILLKKLNIMKNALNNIRYEDADIHILTIINNAFDEVTKIDKIK